MMGHASDDNLYIKTELAIACQLHGVYCGLIRVDFIAF